MSDERPSGPGNDVTPSPAHTGPEHEEPKAFAREVWGTRAGFVLAAVGSAVGLGNMWRFSYLTAEAGGAAFVLVFIFLLLVVGIPVMLAEFTVGRRSRLSPVGALRATGGKGWTPLGYLFVAAGFLILAYYSVIAGWVSRYALEAIFVGFPVDAGAHFGEIAAGMPTIGFHLFFMACVIAIVMIGIEKGIERAAVVMMPLLFLLVVGLALWAVTLPGSGDGYAYYLRPDLSGIMTMETWVAAAGQAFFTLSLGMGAMLTFSSYLSKHESLPREAGIISFADFGVAFVAGLVVFPIIFAFALQGDVGESTVGALFIALPRAFAEMGTLGQAIGTVFFVTLFIGALTSAISLLEVVVASLIDEFKIDRKVAAVAAGTLIAIAGFGPALDTDILEIMDQIAGDLFLVIGALALAIFVGWFIKNPLGEVLEGTGAGMRPWLTGWLWALRYVVPVLLIFVLYYSLQASWAAVSGLFGGG